MTNTQTPATSAPVVASAVCATCGGRVDVLEIRVRTSRGRGVGIVAQTPAAPAGTPGRACRHESEETSVARLERISA